MAHVEGLSKRELEELETEYAALNEETESLKSQGFTLEELEKELEAQEPTKIVDTLRGLSESMRRQQEDINAIDKTLERMIEKVKNNPNEEFVMVSVTPQEKDEAQRYLNSPQGRKMQEKIRNELPKRRKILGIFGGANGEKGASASVSSKSKDDEQYNELVKIAQLYGSLSEKELLERQKNIILQIIAKQIKLKDEYKNPTTTAAQKKRIGKQVLDLKRKKELLKQQQNALLKNIENNSKIAAVTLVSTYQNISPEHVRKIPQVSTKEMPAKVKRALGLKGGKRRKTIRKHNKRSKKYSKKHSKTQNKHSLKRTQKKRKTMKKHTRRSK
uniref:Uncharacterized protein n=1 Tax=viral metagenome TaxID=1070528 RepID=A0A6C0KHP2_9ZZZZ